MDKYPHLLFRKNWTPSYNLVHLLGEVEGLVKSIANTPVLPQDYKRLLTVSLIKGARATTAIEGNTLTENEIEKINAGEKLPPGKTYQETEAKNILDTFNLLLSEVVNEDKEELISDDLIKQFHYRVGKDLGKYFDSIPGQYRTDERIVGRYKCPDPKDVPNLIDNLCKWLVTEFHYSGGQKFADSIIQAIVTHIYIEWIHPFGDGNGRTGRLLEFYILLRGGLPDIASHILSNHYNLTRSEYYWHIENATKKKDLTEFLEYALIGFKDGLQQTLEIVQKSLLKIIWQKYVYDTLKECKLNAPVFNRRLELLTEMSLDKKYTFEEIFLVSPKVAKLYGNVKERTIYREIKDLLSSNLLVADAEKNLLYANINILKGNYLVQRRNRSN